MQGQILDYVLLDSVSEWRLEQIPWEISKHWLKRSGFEDPPPIGVLHIRGRFRLSMLDQISEAFSNCRPTPAPDTGTDDLATIFTNAVSSILDLGFVLHRYTPRELLFVNKNPHTPSTTALSHPVPVVIPSTWEAPGRVTLPHSGRARWVFGIAQGLPLNDVNR